MKSSIVAIFLISSVQLAFAQLIPQLSSTQLSSTRPADARLIPEPTETVDVDHGLLYIYKADSGLAGLRNPVLFVEGIDLYNNQNGPELYTLFNQENLIEELRQCGRDVIILNFEDATQRITDHRGTTKNAIEYINKYRSLTGLTDKFTVIGVSMGGLTSRFALAEIENEGAEHDVDTWISFDAPHEGANIPLGLQKYAEFFKQFRKVAPEFMPMEVLIKALEADSIKGMLIVHHNKSDNGQEAAFEGKREELIKQLTAAGYPTTCKSVAISNGSGLGEKQPFRPGQKIMQWKNPVLPWIDANIYALPQTTGLLRASSEQLVCMGLYYIVDGNEIKYSSYYPYSLDNAPGATGDMIYQLYASLDYIDGDDFLVGTNTCYVPTVSALGIPIEYLDTDLSANPKVLALSPFDEVHTALGNEALGEINPRNKRWFMRAVLEDIDSDGDGLDDYQEYLIGTDHTITDSEPQAQSSVSASSGNTMALSFNALQNIQYKIWFTEALGQPWELLDTIPPSSLATVSNVYDMAKAQGYFKITGELVDPATDLEPIISRIIR